MRVHWLAREYEGCEREGGASAPTPESGEGES